jgi:hypothetical protein
VAVADLRKWYGTGPIHWVWGSLADPEVPERLVAGMIQQVVQTLA